MKIEKIIFGILVLLFTFIPPIAIYLTGNTPWIMLYAPEFFCLAAIYGLLDLN